MPMPPAIRKALAGCQCHPPKASAEKEKFTQASLDHAFCGRVLLAEDGPDNQRLIAFFLEKAGLEVDLAENGLIACQKATASEVEGNPYELILMDMQMPELDGYEATRRLRQNGWRGPIIALTTHAMVNDCKKCIEAGCDGYFSKPIDRAKFLSMIARHLGEAVRG